MPVGLGCSLFARLAFLSYRREPPQRRQLRRTYAATLAFAFGCGSRSGPPSPEAGTSQTQAASQHAPAGSPGAAASGAEDEAYERCLERGLERARTDSKRDGDLVRREERARALCERGRASKTGRREDAADEAACAAAISDPATRRACRLLSLHEIPVAAWPAPLAVMRIAAAMKVFFSAERSDPDAGPSTHHWCAPGKYTAILDTEYQPPLNVRCATGPGGECVPSDSASKAWEYDAGAFAGGTLWGDLGVTLEGPERKFHYRVTTQNTGEPQPGACTFSIEARGDLDGDGEFSSFRMSYAIDMRGMNANARMTVTAPGQ